MTIKKMISAFCLAAGLVIAAPAAASVTGLPQGTAATVQAAAKSGWQKDSTGMYYLKNGKRVTGRQQINGYTYYFNAQGYRQTGVVQIGNNAYYFYPSNGRLLTGKAGIIRLGGTNGTYYCFNAAADGRVARKQWAKAGGKWYYADENGTIKFGTIRVRGRLYHVTRTQGRITGYARSTYDKNYYYAGSNGILKVGLQTINSKLYYFNPATGAQRRGRVVVGGTSYYFNTQSGWARKGWITTNNYTYYFGDDYKQLVGWQTLKGRYTNKTGKYYFNPKNGRRTENGWYNIDSNYYHFDKNGVLQTGWITANGKRYYSDASGKRLYGWQQNIGGRKYFFNKKTGAMETGWKYSNGKYFYLNPNQRAYSYGAALTGWQKISGSWYYFNSPRGDRHSGWLVENDKKYYFDQKTGKMYTGRHTINGVVYDFGTSGAISVIPTTGAWRIEVQRRTPCSVVVYRGNVPVKWFVCSTARDGVSTPSGTFTILDKLYWHELMGPSWGQYCSHITSDVLFHSVPNTRYNDPYSLEYWEYNKLGTQASAGCIRLSVKHAKWLFENIPVGTQVTVRNSIAKPTNGISLETVPKITNNQTWDPTDTFVNPYSVR